MQNYYVQIKLDKQGVVDTNYYIGQAHVVRAETLANGFKILAGWIKSLKTKFFKPAFQKQNFNSTRSIGTILGQ